MTQHIHLTECGLPGIRRIPYGLHACHFYPGRKELLEALVPYFIAGVAAGERCIWVAAPPLPAADAEQALREAWTGVDEALAKGALRIIDFDRWYADTAGLKGTKVVDVWLAEEERALAQGFRGLRITGNTSFLTPADWTTFMEYEREVDRRVQGRRIIALCSYVMGQREKMAEIVRAHHCAFERPDSGWQVAGLVER